MSTVRDPARQSSPPVTSGVWAQHSVRDPAVPELPRVQAQGPGVQAAIAAALAQLPRAAPHPPDGGRGLGDAGGVYSAGRGLSGPSAGPTPPAPGRRSAPLVSYTPRAAVPSDPARGGGSGRWAPSVPTSRVAPPLSLSGHSFMAPNSGLAPGFPGVIPDLPSGPAPRGLPQGAWPGVGSGGLGAPASASAPPLAAVLNPDLVASAAQSRLQGFTIPRLQRESDPAVAPFGSSDAYSCQLAGWPLEYFVGSSIQPTSADFCGFSLDNKPLFRPPHMRSVEPSPPPPSGEAPRVLSATVSRPFWEKVLSDAGLPVEFLPVQQPHTSLGVAERFKYRQQPVQVPALPLAPSTREVINGLHVSGKVGRAPWVPRVLPCREEDKDVFETPLCPEACFDQMEEDKSSRCFPLRPTPKGVESSGPPRASRVPFQVGAWNRGRDDELRKLESLARDGIRVANAQLLAFAHLANSLISPDRALSSEERGLTVEVMRDLSHTTSDHFVKIVEQSVVARRLNATQALNFADRTPLLSAPLGSDLFGGLWPSEAEKNVELRKRKAEQVKRKAKGSASKKSKGRGAKKPRYSKTQPAQQQVMVPAPFQQWAFQQPQPTLQYNQYPMQPVPARGSARGSSRRNRAGRRGGRARGRGPYRGAAAAAMGAPPSVPQSQQHF